MELREYQTSAVDEIKENFAKGQKRTVLCAPTGSGKTVIFTHIAHATRNKGRRVLILTDRKELNEQAGGKIENPVYLTANTKILPEGSIVVAMLETIKRRLTKLDYVEFVRSFDLIIIDEAHKNSFNRLFEVLTEKQFVIGATATPLRTGKMPSLDTFYDAIVQTVDIPDLIQLGFLSKPTSYGVAQDLSKVRITAGDYNEGDMGAYYNQQELYSGVIENYKTHAENSKALVFSATVQNSISLCQEFIENGIHAEHLDAEIPNADRERILADFRSGKFKVLCNVGILTTGYDEPTIETIILYRATKSLPLFLQMCGRGSRVTESKKTFTILDFGNNIAEHGFWESERLWSLKNPKKNKKTKEAAIYKTCPECEAMLPVNVTVCEYCGYEYSKKEKKESKFEYLVQLTPSEVSRIADSGMLSVEELEFIRAEKKYKIGWVCYKMKTFNEFLEYEKLKGYKRGWAKHQWQQFRK